MNPPKKPYHRPVLEDLGTAKELTRVGRTNPGSDTVRGRAMGGSVTLPDPAR